MRQSALLGLCFSALIACYPSTGDTGDTGEPEVNRPPQGGQVEITAVTTVEDLVARVTVEAVDPDGDEVIYSFAWSRDGEPVPSQRSDTVPASATARDQRWTVVVTPSDGELDGEPFSAEVVVLNSAPVVTEVRILPAEAFTDTTLSAEPTGADPDGDDIAWGFAWTVDGESAGQNATLDGNVAFAKGQEVQLTVTPSDGDLEGEPWVSPAIIVQNTPPTEPVVAFDPDPASTASDLVCLIDTPSVDADGDRVSYRFAFIVDGAPFTGRTLTTHHDGDTVARAVLAADQTWTCEATPTDGDDDGPPGRTSTEVEDARCGPLMHTDPKQVVDGWTLCYVAGSDPRDIREAPCHDLVAHLERPVYGCWHGRSTYPHENNNNMLENACRDGVQHTTRYSSWGGTDHILTVCIRD